MSISRVNAALVAAMLALAPVAAVAAPLFDASPPDADLQGFPFWRSVMADSLVATQSCDTDSRHCAPAAWTGFLDTVRKLDARAQLDAVNRWVNARPHVEDNANWGVPDYWETPGEFLARGGDCEDFAIAKYFSLVRLGFPLRDLRILIVSDSRSDSFHALLAVHQGDAVRILDDQVAEVTDLSAQPHYTPIYSLGDQGEWLHSMPVVRTRDGTLIVAASSANFVRRN